MKAWLKIKIWLVIDWLLEWRERPRADLPASGKVDCRRRALRRSRRTGASDWYAPRTSPAATTSPDGRPSFGSRCCTWPGPSRSAWAPIMKTTSWMTFYRSKSGWSSITFCISPEVTRYRYQKRKCCQIIPVPLDREETTGACNE